MLKDDFQSVQCSLRTLMFTNIINSSLDGMSINVKLRPNDHNMSQHCWAQHVACVWPPCCDVLRHVGSSLKLVKFDPTAPNMSQHVATRWPNARNMLRPTMLRYVALACCDRLAGALFFKNHIPYLWDLSNSFSNRFIDFYSSEVFSWIDLRKNKVLSFNCFISIMAVVFKLWIYFI